MMDFFCKNSQDPEVVNCFRKKACIIYVLEGSNYALLAVSFLRIVNKITWKYRSRGS